MKDKLLLLLGCAALMVGCTFEIEGFDEDALQSAPKISIDGAVGQQGTTRLNEGGFTDGDQIGLYGVNYTDENSQKGVLLNEGNQVDNARYTYDEENNIWESTGSIYYKDAKTNIDLFAYYPYSTPEEVNNYEFEVYADQSGENAANGYAMSDFLWGIAENITPTSSKIKINFSHRLSCAKVILAEGEGFADGEFDGLNKIVMVSNTIHTASIDLATGVATAIGDVSAEDIVMCATADGYSAVVVPQNIEANTALFTITIDGIVHHFKLDSDFVFNAGKRSKFTIEISKKSMSGEYEFTLTDCEIVNWKDDVEIHAGEARQYYVVSQDEPGSLSALIRADKKNPAKIKNLKISGKIDARDFNFMRDSMTILQAVNLKECEVVAGWTWRFINYNDGADNEEKTFYFNGKMPSSHDACWSVLRQKYPDFDSSGWGNYSPEGYNADEIPAYAFGREAWSEEFRSYLVYFSFPEKVKKIGRYAFSGTMLSGALVIPDDVEVIEEGAFQSTNISSLELPHHLKTIGHGAFSDCSSLSGGLYLPETLESLGSSAFSNCKLLSGPLAIPSEIKEIPSSCFSSCGFNGDLTIPEGVIKVGSYAFSWCSQLNGRLSLPISLKEIGGSAFSGCGFQGELVIPRELQTIPNYCFSDNQFSSIVFAEDSELLKIDNGAFSGNWRLTEPIELPKELLTIGSYAFSYCRTIPKIVIPASVTTINERAFADDYGITDIVIEAVMPPTLGADVFAGVGKDNLTLEVPEASVARYQSTLGWSDFKRISAHHDFSISRRLMRTLNAEYSKTYTLRAPANQSWSVKSKPEWVTVTPASGTGKCEVTVTVSQMASTYDRFEVERKDECGSIWTDSFEGRAGEIVFALDDKDYTSTMQVEQYNYKYGDGDVIVNQKATKGGGVNIVFMGDCFDAQDIATGKYLSGINEAIGYYFAIEPYKSYKEYFNVYTVVGMSVDSGVGTVNTIKEAKFGSQYALNGIEPDTATTFEYAMKTETVNESNLGESLVVMIENTTDYGGVCYMWRDGSAIAVCPMSRDAYPFDFRGLVQHEAGGHGFAKLADEYIYHNAFIESCCCCCCQHLDGCNGFLATKALGWYRNLSTNGDMKTVEWSHFIFHPDYSNVVDMYEGGFFHSRGIYRSEATSCMNNNIPYYSAIQRQEMVERIMRYAGEEFSLDDFYAKDVRDASNNEVTRVSEPTAAERASASKQMAPRIMGEKPVLNK